MSPLTWILVILYALTMGVLSIIFLTNLFRLRRQISKYLSPALGAGAIFLGLELLIVLISPHLWNSTLVSVLAVDVGACIRLIGFTMLGMHYCAELGYPKPFARRPPEIASSPQTLDARVTMSPDDSPASLANLLNDGSDSLSLDQANAELEGSAAACVLPQTPLERNENSMADSASGPRRAETICVATLVCVAYSMALLAVTQPRLSDSFKALLGGPDDAQDGLAMFRLIVVGVVFAFVEELTFRLGIQSFLAQLWRDGGDHPWPSIVMTSTLWTLGHAGALEPEWVKMIQIFPIGLLLGWLFKTHGVWSCILVHTLFNVLLMPIGQYFLTS